MGTAFGAIVGLGLWLGLVFASAFYLVGLGHYAAAVLGEVGIELSLSPVVPMGLLFAVVLTALSVTGTENTAKLQNVVVALLLVVLTLFLSYGSLDALGVFGRQTVPEAFFSRGYFPVLSTAALVFTSYLGFAQVATVAGDIKQPGRNLPLAMVGSVLVVTVFYVVTIFVATSAFGASQLSGFGETAMVEVARDFLGLPGAVAILFAGLLATFSSANASILSASRTVYALSRDALLPGEPAGSTSGTARPTSRCWRRAARFSCSSPPARWRCSRRLPRSSTSSCTASSASRCSSCAGATPTGTTPATGCRAFRSCRSSERPPVSGWSRSCSGPPSPSAAR